MNTLYWFTRDLRLHDNAALLAASKSDMLLCVYGLRRARNLDGITATTGLPERQPEPF